MSKYHSSTDSVLVSKSLVIDISNVTDDFQVICKQEATGVTDRVADISLIETWNNEGPKIEPCGTPDFMVYECEEKETGTEACLQVNGFVSSWHN